LLTTAENRPHKQVKAIIPVKNGRAKKAFGKPDCTSHGSSGEPSPLIALVNVAVSGSHQRNPV